jgi:RNA polymerase sigma-70 factor (ECF subfamily)
MVAELTPALLGSTLECAVSATEASPAADDALAMARLARGEIDALGELYDRHQAAVRRFAVRMTQRSDADDLVHATFLAAMSTAQNFDPERSCRAWLLGITSRLIQRQRTVGARWARLLRGFGQTAAKPARDPESLFSERENLERGLERLSEAKRAVLVLAEVEGLSGEEIAEVLAIPIGTVWTRLHHARRELSAALEPEGRQ